MVDWTRVHQLRSKGQSWSEIARDPEVDFHPDAAAGDPGRQLRAMYHRSGRRFEAVSTATEPPKRVSKEEKERRWTLTRAGYLALPVAAVWFLLAYAAPSPVGVLVPAIPYLGLVLAGAAFVLLYALWRKTEGPRWSSVYRRTVVGGVVLGLVVAGSIGVAAAVAFGCPYLPPSSSFSSESSSGWSTGPLPSWHASGVPVMFFYGATWCPYCSASSWALYKALTEFGSVTNVVAGHSSTSDVYGGTPEVVLADLSIGAKNGHPAAVNLQAVEDTTGVRGSVPGTANCYQQAYVTAYSGGSIPFVVINGNILHLGTLVDPTALEPYNSTNDPTNGWSTVQSDIVNENGAPWTAVQGQAWWVMAFLTRAIGTPVGTLSSEYGWSTATTNGVTADLSALGVS
jgi:hypothetical protein